MLNAIPVYDLHQPGPIMPVVEIKQNLSVYTGGGWEHSVVEYIEGHPLGSQSVIDLLQIAPVAASIAANGTLAKRAIPQLRPNNNELLILRWKPLDYLEGILWEQPNKARFESRALLSRVDFRSGDHDPYFAATTFAVFGVSQGDRDINVEARNPAGWAIPMARFEFWGYRYTLTPIVIPDKDKKACRAGDTEVVKRIVGATKWIVAEGRSA